MSENSIQLYNSVEFRDALKAALNSAKESVAIMSAFTTHQALQWVLDEASTDNIKIVARWSVSDLSSGASDFESYWACKSRHVPFGVSPRLHGKVYCVDGQVFVGSANITSSGLALLDDYNLEFGVGFQAGRADVSKIEKFFATALWLDDQLVTRMQEYISIDGKLPNNSPADWPVDISSLISPAVEYLWVHEIPRFSPTEWEKLDRTDHALAMFPDGLTTADTSDEFDALRKAYEKSRAFRWFKDLVYSSEVVTFGGITAALHRTLLDDPSPYRKKVKQLVEALISWAKLYPDIFEVSRPRHTTVVKRAMNSAS